MNLSPFLCLLTQISIISTVFSLNRPNSNSTLQLCCQPAEYFNISRYKCERIPRTVNVNWNLKIQFVNKTEKEVNVFRNFIYKIKLPCEKPEALYWQINEAKDIDVATNPEYCFTPFYLEGKSKKYALVQLDCRMELHYFLAFKHEYLYASSGILLVPTLIVYIMLKPLNRNLMGKCFICYLGSVIFTNSFYLIIPQLLLIKHHIPNLVYISTALTHFYLNMALVCWLNVLGFDAWKNFNETSHEELTSHDIRKRFLYYSSYVWSMSAIASAPTIWRNFFNIFELCKKYQQSKSCVMLAYGILYQDIYFAPVVMTILVFNFLIFCSVSWKVYKIGNQVAIYNDGFHNDNTIICLRLFVLMGPQWILMYLLKDYEFIEILILFLNYIESICIFILFVLRKSVLSLLFKK